MADRTVISGSFGCTPCLTVEVLRRTPKEVTPTPPKHEGQQDARYNHAGLSEILLLARSVVGVRVTGGVLTWGHVDRYTPAWGLSCGRARRPSIGVGLLDRRSKIAVGGGLLAAELVGNGAFDERRAGDLHPVGACHTSTRFDVPK